MSTLKTFENKKTRKTDKNSNKIKDLARSATTHAQDSLTDRAEHAFAARAATTKTPIAGYDALFKRLFDLVIGGIAFLLLLPLLAVLAILIKLDSKGPVLFYQHRRGRNQELIKVFKFRTMHQHYSTPVPTATSFKQTQKNDPRVTRIGTILRKVSLDELPQLLNVMQGSMSLVGPRPHPAPLDEKFKHLIPKLSSRYAIKPGITGWAQINGFRGETTRVEDMISRVEHDCHYIKNWTPWLDIKIIAMTAVKGWTHQNAY